MYHWEITFLKPLTLSTANFASKKYVKEVSCDYKVWNNDGYNKIQFNDKGKQVSKSLNQDFSWPSDIIIILAKK